MVFERKDKVIMVSYKIVIYFYFLLVVEVIWIVKVLVKYLKF